MSQKIVITLFFLFATLVCLPPALRAEQPVTLNLDPTSISISAFYNGTDVKVSGEAPADAELLIRLTGTRHDVTLKKKGKVGGLLWMNIGEVTFENVPSVYLLYTSKALGEMATSDNSNKWDSMGLGFDAIKQDMKVMPTTNDKEVVFKEFMKLKKHEELYKLNPDAVQFANTNGAMKILHRHHSCAAATESGRLSGGRDRGQRQYDHGRQQPAAHADPDRLSRFPVVNGLRPLPGIRHHVRGHRHLRRPWHEHDLQEQGWCPLKQGCLHSCTIC